MNTRTIINLLRQAGIVLIALPEPFTTPLGVACIAAAQYMSKSLEKARLKLINRKKFNRLPEDFIFPEEIDNNSFAGKKLNYYSYARGSRHRIAARYQYNRKAIESQAIFYAKAENNQTIQNINIKPDLERFARIKAQEIMASREHSNLHIDPKMIPHKVNIDALSRRYQDLSKGNKVNTEIIKCNVNMKLLQKHRDYEKRQNESAKIKAPKLEIRLHDIDAESLIKRYRKGPFSGALPA